jgi:phenylpyruvate tautomerase PptA (4-oxalocrotonate tautomerase family)
MAVASVELCWEAGSQTRRAVIEAVAEVLVDTLRVPAGEPTVIAVVRHAEDVVFPAKLRDRYTIVTVSLFSGRSLATKRLLYERIVQRLHRCGVAPTDVLIVLDEVPVENWGVDGGSPASDVDVGFKIDV